MFFWALSACATTTTGPGKQLTELPAGFEWCGDGPQSITATQVPDDGSGGGVFPSSIFTHCTKIVREETSDSEGDEPWAGSIVFGLNTNEHGRVTSVCVWAGNFGNVKRYAQCLADTMLRENYAFPPNQKKAPYRMTYVYD